VCLPAHAVSGKDKNRNRLHGPGSVHLNLCPFMRLQTPRKNRVRNMKLTKVNNRASIIEKCYDTLFSMNSVFCSEHCTRHSIFRLQQTFFDGFKGGCSFFVLKWTLYKEESRGGGHFQALTSETGLYFVWAKSTLNSSSHKLNPHRHAVPITHQLRNTLLWSNDTLAGSQ
jgi:hypothetical protein